jgi:hypothetical protein
MIGKIITVILLLMILGTAGLWWRSYGTFTVPHGTSNWLTVPGWDANVVGDPVRSGGISLSGADGYIRVYWNWTQSNDEGPLGLLRSTDATYGVACFGWMRRGTTLVAVSAPFWFVLGLFSAQPTYMFIRGPFRRWRRRRQGRCLTCGYDLTGNVSGICSECGTPIALDGAATTSV